MIYLDNNATTALDPEVFAEMQPFMNQLIGNPSSIHFFGQKAKGVLIEATHSIAGSLGVRPDELIFTSGATEALNILIRSIPKGCHVITSSLEHSAVLEPLKSGNYEVSYLNPEPGLGAIKAKQVEEAIQPNTALIILTAANNETGIKTDLRSIAEIALKTQIPFVVDSVALLGKEPLELHEGISAMCFSGHKFHAPLGIGVMFVRKPFKAHPLILGGHQQRGLRAGTENLPGIIGLKKALELVDKQGACWSIQIKHLRDRFEAGLKAALQDLVIHGEGAPRICNTSNISFLGVDGETLLIKLDLARLAASHGSACASGSLEPSRVLLNMGIDPSVARSSIRFSLSRMTTEEEIEQSIRLIGDLVSSLRRL